MSGIHVVQACECLPKFLVSLQVVHEHHRATLHCLQGVEVIADEIQCLVHHVHVHTFYSVLEYMYSTQEEHLLYKCHGFESHQSQFIFL